MLPFQAAVTLLTFIAASVLALTRGTAAIVIYHIIFSIGIMPLILAAMIHFVPVLARSKPPGPFIRRLPAAALLGGVIATSDFAFPQTAVAGRYIGAAIVMTTLALLGRWAYQSGNKAIGRPHPCLDWYLAAMACLFAAVSVILLGYLIPAQGAAFRLFHLHLNTMGFVGITALGTLQVLLPTTAQRPDPDIARRMRLHLKWVVAGTVMTACGVAWYPALAWIGIVPLAVPVFGLIKSWSRLYAREIFRIHGATPVLATALCGYTATLALGAGHLQAFNPVATFIIAFLMPLVTGAVSYLLPLWLRPGQQTAWHHAGRRRLGYLGGVRALVFLIAGVTAGWGHVIGWYMAAIATGIFLAQVIGLLTLKCDNGLQSRFQQHPTEKGS